MWLILWVAVGYVSVRAVVAVWHVWRTPPGDISVAKAAAKGAQSGSVEAQS